MNEERRKFADRFTEIAAQLGYEGHGRQTNLANHYHKKQPSVKKWFDGDSQPDYEICVDMCKRAKVHFEWLMTGRGNKLFGEKNIDESERRLHPAVDEATQAVLDMMLATDNEGKILVKNAVIDALTLYQRRQDQLARLTAPKTEAVSVEYGATKQSSASG